MRRDGTAHWFNDAKGFGFIAPKAPVVERHRATFFTVDDVDLMQWERTFNRTFGLN